MLAYVCADGDIEWAFNQELANDLPKAKGASTRMIGLLDRRLATTRVPDLPDGAHGGALARFVEFDASLGVLQDRGPLVANAPPSDGDMGSPATLEALVRFGTSDLGQDERIVLAMCGHGAGCDWVCRDASNDNHKLEIESIASPMVNSLPLGRRVDVAVLYACNMATVEAAHAFSAFADHYIASQETVPFDINLTDSGFDCSALRLLDTAQSAEDFFGTATAPGFARSYLDGPGQHLIGKTKTLSLTRTGTEEFASLVKSIRALGTALLAGMSDPIGAADVRAAIEDASSSCWEFAPRYRGWHARLVDLLQSMSALKHEVTRRAGISKDLSAAIVASIESVEKAVPTATTSAASAGASPWCGLSIYLPLAPSKEELDDYDKSCDIDEWVAMLRAYAKSPPSPPTRWGPAPGASGTPAPSHRWMVRGTRAGSPRQVWIALRDANGDIVATHVERVSPSSGANIAVELPQEVLWLESAGNRILLPVVARRVSPVLNLEVCTLLGEVKSDRVDGRAPVAIDVAIPPVAPGGPPPAPLILRATVVGIGGSLFDHHFADGDWLRAASLGSIDGAGQWKIRQAATSSAPWLRIGGFGADALRALFAAAPDGTSPELLLVPEPAEASVFRLLDDGKTDEWKRSGQPN